MSDPPDKKAAAVNSLLAYSRNVTDRRNRHLEQTLAEAFLENLYAWLVEKGPPPPQLPPDVKSK